MSLRRVRSRKLLSRRPTCQALNMRGMEDLAEEWNLAVEDAGLAPEDCLLEVLDRLPSRDGRNSVLLDPGTTAFPNPDEPLRDEQTAKLNSERWRAKYRVLFVPTHNRA